MGMDATTIAEMHAAALLHDLGRTAVSSEVWDRAGAARAGRPRARAPALLLDRARPGALSGLAPLSRHAAAHHERLDGSGYHRGASATELRPAARLLAAADAFAAMTESRPHRPRLPRADAARELLAAAAAGKLDPGAAAAVIEAAGCRGRAPPGRAISPIVRSTCCGCARGA